MYIFEVIFYFGHLIYKNYSLVRKKNMYANDKTLGSFKIFCYIHKFIYFKLVTFLIQQRYPYVQFQI